MERREHVVVFHSCPRHQVGVVDGAGRPAAEPAPTACAAAACGAASDLAFTPKAPSCSSRWRELLGLKRAAAA